MTKTRTARKRKPTKVERRFITPVQLADFLGVAPDLIYGYIKKGTVPAVRFGEKILLIPASYLDSLESAAYSQSEQKRKFSDGA